MVVGRVVTEERKKEAAKDLVLRVALQMFHSFFESFSPEEVRRKSSFCPSDKLSPLFDKGLSFLPPPPPFLSLFETSLARTTPISARLLCTYKLRTSGPKAKFLMSANGGRSLVKACYTFLGEN